MIVRPSVVLVNPLDDLQAAIDSVSPNGGVVQLGPGTFTATWRTATNNAGGLLGYQMWLSIPSNVVMRGQGKATKLVLPVATNNSLAYIGIVMDDCVDGGVESLQIQGSQTDDTHGNVIGVYVVGASKRTATRNVLFSGVSASTGCNTCWDIGGEVATDLGYHIAEDNEVVSCIGTATSRGLAFDVNSSSYNTVRGNRVTFLANDGRHGIYLAGSCTNNVVENNYINGGTWQAIQVYNQATTGTISSFNVVRGNWITGSKGIIVSLRTDYNEVSSNTVLNSSTVGITLAGDGNAATQITSNNVVKNNYIYKPQNQGILVSGTQGSIISGNVIYGANQSNSSLGGIHVVWAGDVSLVTGVRIVGNTILTDPTTNKQQRESIVIDGGHIAPLGVMVVGNALDAGNVATYQNEGNETIASGNAMSTGGVITNAVSYEDDYVMYDDDLVVDNSALTY